MPSYGQSNMAWPLSKITGADIARAQADMPMLRHFRIQTNEQTTLQTDIRPEAVVNGGWEVSTSETAGERGIVIFYEHRDRIALRKITDVLLTPEEKLAAEGSAPVVGN